jgi:hypothetical protein
MVASFQKYELIVRGRVYAFTLRIAITSPGLRSFHTIGLDRFGSIAVAKGRGGKMFLLVFFISCADRR